MYKTRHSGMDARIQSQGERSEGSVQCKPSLALDSSIHAGMTATINTHRFSFINLQAKKMGLITLVKPLLNKLRHQAGFWIDNKLYQICFKCG